MDINLTPLRRTPSFPSWLRGRIDGMLAYDTPFWRTATAGVSIVCAGMLTIVSFGMPTGFGPMFDSLLITLLGMIGLAAAAVVAALVLSLMNVPVPRMFAGAVLYTGYIIYYCFSYADAGLLPSVAIAVFLTLSGALGGMFMAMLAHRSVHAAVKIASVLLLASGCLSFSYEQKREAAHAVPVFAAADAAAAAAAAASVEPLAASDPGAPGPYRYSKFTYGSGKDRHRTEFGSNVSVRSDTVDASAYIKHWPWLRSLYWGFDQKELPLNGRVWMPEGQGPFPLVLIVHGNHLMEQASDDGYAYLGELLASRGFIAVSIDENFLNYSVWADIPDQDMKMRAWILLQHLRQVSAFAKEPGNPFFNRVDMGNVALIGHSRGGQAVAMAADRSRWFADDRTLDGMGGIDIRAVAAIAPTDNVIDGKSAQLKDTYYLTLQGASDGDVDTFNGERQYIRTTFDSAGRDRFKAAVYIAEANHSRFNTDWGTMDDSLPGGLLLKRSGMMPAGDQRQVAKVYISAFLETALHGSSDYAGLFKDYRSGAAWLPKASYMSRYEDGRFRDIARFEDDAGIGAFEGGVKAAATTGLKWSEENLEDRDGKNKGSRGVVLQWNGSTGGAWSLSLPLQGSKAAPSGRAASLAFSMTNLERDLLGSEDGVTELPLPNVTIELQSADGEAASLPLESFMPVVRPPHTAFTISPWLEERIKDGKYKQSTESVLQTYLLPLARFQAENPRFNPGKLTRITFRFSGGPGKIMLDDIGFES